VKIIRTINELKDVIKKIKLENNLIGFVPTMGYLHEGHLQLVKTSKKQANITVVSIFVNPLQFGPNEDYETYPRDFVRDQTLLEQEKVDILFCPSVEEMYPHALTSSLVVNDRTNVLCGRTRVGHFEGVATVLTKLFHIVQPDKVFMGSKDAQQVAVVMGLVEDLNFNTTIVPVPTVRESDGLAKSSRNIFLTESERNEAKYLYQSLLLGQKLFEESTDIEYIKSKIIDFLDCNTTGVLDYMEILSYPELKEVEDLSKSIIIALAMKYSKARLIDNIIFTNRTSEEENKKCSAQ